MININSRPRAAIPNRNGLNLGWLIKLRWGAVGGQLATILGVHTLLGIDLPFAWLLPIVAVEIVSNVAISLWFRSHAEAVEEWQLASVMSLDVVFLTLLLLCTGGPENPFAMLYLVNIALAAVALRAQWTWLLVALALLAIGLLPLIGYLELPIIANGGTGGDQQTYRRGMWVALGVTAVFIVHFLLRIRDDLAQRDVELSAAKEITARQKQLTSLATIAAGAAHELATPLGTIALVAKELERSIDDFELRESSLEDLHTIREQVVRCRLILDQMGGSFGRSAEQGLEETKVSDLIFDALIGLRVTPPVNVDLDAEVRDTVLCLPGHALSQALRALITNAQDASVETPVSVRATISDRRVLIEVSDRGVGMSSDVSSRVFEPFFTTKAPGLGMGLGMYLTKAVIETLGGSVLVESVQGEGTRVLVDLPKVVDAQEIREYANNAGV